MDGDICTPDQLALAANSSTPFTCLTRGQSIGLFLSTETGAISLAALLFVFAKILYGVVKTRRWRIIKQPIELFLFSLFVADTVQALGAVTSAKWVHDGIVQLGPYCRAQGLLQNFGEITVAFNTIVIALYTFVFVRWHKSPSSLLIPTCIVAVMWTSTFLFTIILLTINKEHWRMFYGPSPYWCWIVSQHIVFKIVGEYLWLWMALFISIICYIPLLFWILGYITVDNKDPWWRFHFHLKRQVLPDQARRTAFCIIAYPFIYSIIVLPTSAVRLNQFVQQSKGHHVSVPARDTFATEALFNLSGACNVLLFFVTRQGLFTDPPAPHEAPQISSTPAAPRSSTSSFRVPPA